MTTFPTFVKITLESDDGHVWELNRVALAEDSGLTTEVAQISANLGERVVKTDITIDLFLRGQLLPDEYGQLYSYSRVAPTEPTGRWQ